MAAINTKNVHRTNALRGYPYGRDFTYSEMMFTGDGAEGPSSAPTRGAAPIAHAELAARLRADARAAEAIRVAEAGPRPEQGSSARRACYEVLFVGKTADGRTLRASVSGDKDPGYGSTSKMISEAALCLNDTPREQRPAASGRRPPPWATR